MKHLLVAALLSLLALNLSAQDNFSGTWKTDKDNTLVKIEKQNDVFIGKVISSDDQNTKPGTLIIKDLKAKKGKWEGQIYVAARKKWFNGSFLVSDNQLKITVTLAIISKTVVWTKSSE